MPIYEFSENNSSGVWWLSRQDYEALFEAGFYYEPSEYDKAQKYDTEPFLNDPGDTTPYGWRHNLKVEASSIEEAVKLWESATHQNFFAGGCPCCGPPFSMSSEYGSGKYESMSGGYEEMERPF